MLHVSPPAVTVGKKPDRRSALDGPDAAHSARLAHGVVRHPHAGHGHILLWHFYLPPPLPHGHHHAAHRDWASCASEAAQAAASINAFFWAFYRRCCRRRRCLSCHRSSCSCRSPPSSSTTTTTTHQHHQHHQDGLLPSPCLPSARPALQLVPQQIHLYVACVSQTSVLGRCCLCRRAVAIAAAAP